MADVLTESQEKFVQNILKGMSQKDAYIKAFPRCKTKNMNTVYNRASLLQSTPKIQQRLDKLKNQVEKKLVEKLVYSREQSFKNFEKYQEIALNQDKDNLLGRIDMSAVLKAEEQKGKLFELYTQSVKVTNFYGGILDNLDNLDGTK